MTGSDDTITASAAALTASDPLLTPPTTQQASPGFSSLQSSPRRSYRWERSLLPWLLHRVGDPVVTLELWDGTAACTTSRSIGRIRLNSPSALRRLLLSPDVGFGEAYMEGELSVTGDLIEVLTEVNLGLGRRTAIRPHVSWHQKLWNQMAHTFSRSLANVVHHYDLGNHFYQLWLDPQLVYTCAYYVTPQMSLTEAQTAKLDYVCRKLRLQPGERVAEAGCGWGALALHMARHYGVTVDAWNLSREQIAYARDRAQREGLSDRVTFHQDDYRHMTGQFDAVVSIGMLEHVGVERYAGFSQLLHQILAPHGRGLIHSIGRNWARPLDRWTTKYIFPGAAPGSLRQMQDLFETGAFCVHDVENLRLHYARTCADWLANFEQAATRVQDLLGEKFVRMWRLYLAASSAAFLSGDLQLFQIVFARSTNNELPITRGDWYSTPPLSATAPA